MATSCGLLALAWPRSSPIGRPTTARLPDGNARRIASPEAELLECLRDARGQLLRTAEHDAHERRENGGATPALERARELEEAIALLEQLRRRPADPLDPERRALLCAAQIQLLGAELPGERRVAAELRVRGLRAELERALSSETPVVDDAASASGTTREAASLEGDTLELHGSATALEIELRSAPASALLVALLARLELRAEPRPESSSPLRFRVRARGVDAEQLLRDVAGSLDWRIADELANHGRGAVRLSPWSAVPSIAEREAMLERIDTASLALETAPLGDLARAEARFVRARALEERGQGERALAEYAQLAAASGSGAFAVEALHRSAEIHARRGDALLELATWERVIARAPDEPLRSRALLRSADLQLASGLRDAARERYEQILRSRLGGAAERAARLGRLACRFERELAQATPQRLRLLASELAEEANARRDPALRSRYLALSSALLRRIGATPLALRETLAACVEETDTTRRAQAALAAAELALELQAPLAALWSLELAPSSIATRSTELRAAALAQLGHVEAVAARGPHERAAAEMTAPLATSRESTAAPTPEALERILARLRERPVTQELAR
ncbi:MAG: hypothetical protein IPN34_20640 [Planctomycetes bacterium]|nr:hypothetical protein [Planctomycetota bacterium]